MQEGRVAAAAAREVLPSETVAMRRLNSYPCVVTVFQVRAGRERAVFEHEQRAFFRKNDHRGLPLLREALRKLVK